MKMTTENIPVAVGALLINEQGQVLACHRRGESDNLCLPGGKREEGETDEEALVRELREETGLTPTKFEKIFNRWDGAGFFFLVYRVTEWYGDLKNEEGLLSGWVAPSDLLKECCSFRAYNRNLFLSLGINI